MFKCIVYFSVTNAGKFEKYSTVVQSLLANAYLYATAQVASKAK